MNLSLRIFVGYFLVLGLAAFVMVNTFVEELRPAIRHAMEDTLVDTSQLLAEVVADDMAAGRIDQGRFAAAVERYRSRNFNAAIQHHVKTTPHQRIYITDADGIVRYDSIRADLGADFSRWHDVRRTLAGQYGARSSPLVAGDRSTGVMYVAAPITLAGGTIGVLTVGKPYLSIQPFIDAALAKMKLAGVAIVLFSLMMGALFSWWFTGSLRTIVGYADAVAAGQRVTPPRLAGTQMRRLGNALAAMRTRLEGRQYVEQTVLALTHELKSPLAAIRGAAELLAEDLPTEARQRFVDNIRNQGERLQRLIERMLDLARLEYRQTPPEYSAIDAPALLERVAQARAPQLTTQQIDIQLVAEVQNIWAESFLVEQAVGNLLDNAIDFSPTGGRITLAAQTVGDGISLSVRDHGSGIPDYAVTRVAERFFSLPRADGRRSSGLGLPFAQQVADLHHGRLTVRNADGGGVLAELWLPAGQPQP